MADKRRIEECRFCTHFTHIKLISVERFSCQIDLRYDASGRHFVSHDEFEAKEKHSSCANFPQPPPISA
jgi:hypothetical protein